MVPLCLKILSELNMYPSLMMPMQKQATGKAAWGHATCYVMVKSVEYVGQPTYICQIQSPIMLLLKF